MWTKRVGNCKPPVLQNTEREVWKALLYIASGAKTPLLALLECFDRIDWDAVRNADCPNWFTDGFDDEGTAVLKNVNDFDLASDVPGDWTNAQTFLDAVAKRAADSRTCINNEPNVSTETAEKDNVPQPNVPQGTDLASSLPASDPNIVPVETPVIEPAETPVIEPAETPAVNPAETPVIEPAETPAIEPTKTPVIEPAETPVIEPADTPAVDPAETPVIEPTETPAVEPAEGPAVDPAGGSTASGDANLSRGDEHQPIAVDVDGPAPDPPADATNTNLDGHLEKTGPNSSQNKCQLDGTENLITTPSKPDVLSQPVKNRKRKKDQDLNDADLKPTRSVTVKRISSLARDIPAPVDLVESQVTHKKVEYIDIDDIMSGRPDTDLDYLGKPEKTTNKGRPSFTVYTARGQAKTVTPELHGQYQLDSVFALFDASVASYTNEKPNFITSIAESAFVIMTEEASKTEDQKALLNLLSSKVLVLTESDVELTSFDENGLSELKDLAAVISVHDYSIPPKAGRYGERSKRTTLETILACSRDPEGKILNALDIPMGWKGAAPTPFSSETRAWLATEGLPYCKDDNLPGNALRWALVTTKGAHHPWHIDANGCGAFLVCGCGGKLIFIGTPIEKRGSQQIDVFLDNFNPYGPCSDKWKIEAIYLEPGDKIILPPNTLHSVLTTENTICYGGHLFTSTTMTDTLVGIIHTFFCNDISTNTDHAEWRDLIHRMTVFYHDIIVSRNPVRDRRTLLHAPELTDLQSILNLFSTCAASILMNAFSVETYKSAEETSVVGQFLHSSHREMYDLNAMNGFTRAKCIHHRALAWEIIHHVDARYIFKNRATGEGLSAFDHIFVPFISNLARAAIAYDKKIASLNFKPSIIELPAGAFETQVKACFHTHPIILDAIDKCDDAVSLIFPFDFDCLVSPAPGLEHIPVGRQICLYVWNPLMPDV
ncbi:hypothetical protein GALMADRAFT_260264 [Galerina marginata CBS 339.88]|uniref:JmjC domain-containing protein n=1 Tax=Galerina marginata (strain CBS 339.88) TaxID=685588 RepID=A0A067S3H1_GALM3|nr:hypothetical protein GALMADRAFT_260264 [Galerina marginata CBS 339.88]